MKRNPAKDFDCNRGIYMYFMSFWRKVTLSNIMEMKDDVTKQIEMMSC